MHKIYDFNYDWQFFPHHEKNIESKSFSSQGEMVTIPHTPRMEALDVVKPFMGVMYYRKLFKIPSELASKRIFIDFDGVMTKATVYVNGAKLARHYGGYLPFSVDITRHVKMNEHNLIVVEVDNRDSKSIPPGKPTSDVDFLYYGGMYRSVTLRAVDKIYIDQPVGKRAGGVFAYTEKVADNTAYLGVDVKVVNHYFKKVRLHVCHYILDAEGIKVSEVQTRPLTVADGKIANFSAKLVVTDPVLWDIEHPYLYTLRSEVYASDELVDVVDTTIGIRTVKVTEEGFYLNDRLVRLNGVNRHQQFPYIGIAGSDNLDRRDIRHLKDAGFNIVRLSHYPQSEALMDECDRLGMMVMVATPGWQFCQAGVFKKRVLENLRDMVLRDRNHPSAVIWEASLNETGFWWMGASDTFFRQCVDTVRATFAPHSVLVCGDTIGRRNWHKVGYDIPFTGWDNSIKIRVLDGHQLGITREYGDYEFGGHNSTTRVRRQDGEMMMRVQAFNFQWSHNMNIGSPYELGDLIWEGIDHNRGMGQNKPTSTSGILNEWRIPKYSYYFFRSQRDDEDMVYLPTFWDGATNGKLTVYSNGDEVELLINGEVVERRAPNNGETVLFDKSSLSEENSVDYWQKGGVYDTENKAFDLAKHVLSRMDMGGDATNLAHPPFTFDSIEYVAGEIEARAYRNGKCIATHIVRTPLEAERIMLEVDYMGLKLVTDGRDKVFVHAYVVDANGTPVDRDDMTVHFDVVGGEVLGSADSVAETGIASAIVRAERGASNVSVTATLGEMQSEISIDIESVDVETL